MGPAAAAYQSAKSCSWVHLLSAYQFFHLWSFSMRVTDVVTQPKKPAKPKQAASTKTDWEKNAAKLRTKERKLKPQSPVPPIKHYP